MTQKSPLQQHGFKLMVKLHPQWLQGKQSRGNRTTSHRNDSAAACTRGADPFTQSRERQGMVQKDDRACEGPRVAILAEESKQYPRLVKLYFRVPSEHCTLATSSMSHWERKESHIRKPLSCVLCSGVFRWRALCTCPWLVCVGFKPLLTAQGSFLLNLFSW